MERAPRERPPYDISAITDQLFIAARPRAHHVSHVRGLGVDLVISMIWLAPPRELTRPPFRLVRLPTVDSPLFPIPMFMLHKGVKAAMPVMDEGGRVLVHCYAGRHRSVAMAACILIARGMSADDAMRIIITHRAIADPYIWYIERRIRSFEDEWRTRERTWAAV